MNFITTTENRLGLLCNENYRIVEAYNGCIAFSYTKQGKGMAIHLASNKQGLRQLRSALDEFCGLLFENYAWCELIIGVIAKPSICRIAEKCSFYHIANDSEMKKIYTRLR